MSTLSGCASRLLYFVVKIDAITAYEEGNSWYSTPLPRYAAYYTFRGNWKLDVIPASGEGWMTPLLVQ
jgi:hypothetical protein